MVLMHVPDTDYVLNLPVDCFDSLHSSVSANIALAACEQAGIIRMAVGADAKQFTKAINEKLKDAYGGQIPGAGKTSKDFISKFGMGV